LLLLKAGLLLWKAGLLLLKTRLLLLNIWLLLLEIWLLLLNIWLLLLEAWLLLLKTGLLLLKARLLLLNAGLLLLKAGLLLLKAGLLKAILLPPYRRSKAICMPVLLWTTIALIAPRNRRHIVLLTVYAQKVSLGHLAGGDNFRLAHNLLFLIADGNNISAIGNCGLKPLI